MGHILDGSDQLKLFQSSSVRFDDFVREQREALVSFIRRRVFSEDDVQDLAQESFARLIHYREHAPDAWKPLLYRIALNVLNDRARLAQAHHTADHVSLDENVHKLASSDPSHEHQVATQQELASVRKALLGLSTRCRDIYLLNRIEGMSYPEIARHCGISVKAVEKQISKALASIRRSLDGGNMNLDNRHE